MSAVLDVVWILQDLHAKIIFTWFIDKICEWLPTWCIVIVLGLNVEMCELFSVIRVER